ncbi:hypothetical protein MMC32_006767 [Xylographa parallela]|nr:hypothetical protein [Xylographa parallela]
MSDRPSRFEDYLRLRAETKEPYELTELRYRIAVVDKIMLKCGYGPTTAWDNADPDLLDIWNHLVMDGDPCLAESLPLDVLEHLEDIMTKYEDAPIGLQDGITEQAQDLIDSEDEFEDEIDEEPYLGDSFWGRLNGSMDLLQFLGVQPFGRRTDAVAALIGLLIGNLSPPADANWTSLGVGPVGVDAPDEALYELLQTSYTGPLVPDSPLSGSPEPGSPVPGLPDSILSDSGSQESMDFPQPPIYRPQLTRNRRHDDDYVPSDSSDELDFL